MHLLFPLPFLDVISKWRGHTKVLIKQNCEQDFGFQTPSEWDTVYQPVGITTTELYLHDTDPDPDLVLSLWNIFNARKFFLALVNSWERDRMWFCARLRPDARSLQSVQVPLTMNTKTCPQEGHSFCVGLIFNLYYFYEWPYINLVGTGQRNTWRDLTQYCRLKRNVCECSAIQH